MKRKKGQGKPHAMPKGMSGPKGGGMPKSMSKSMKSKIKRMMK